MEKRENERLERRIDEWRGYLRRRRAIHAADVDELEDHLRDQIGALREAELDDDEAFLVAVKRLGDLDSLSREFAREYSERLWKQLIASPEDEAGSEVGKEALVAESAFYMRNLSLFVLPLLAGYFAWKRGLGRISRLWLAVPFAAAVVIVNVMPFESPWHTEVLAAMHLPIALWLSVGYAYTGGRWRDHDRRMDFVRFSGEWFIYYALIALGGGVLMGLTAFLFQAIGLDPERLVTTWVLPCGAAGAVLISAWLGEAKQSVIENMAPVLTRLFTPLFAAVLVAFLATMLWTGSGIDVEREVLIGFDLLLVLVLGLLLYSISARDPQAPPGAFDALQLVLVVCALAVDAFALWAIAGRIFEFGFSPNKVAALGENLVLLANLGGSAALYARFLARRGSFARLVRWQTAYLPVYAVWAWVVVALFPPLFGYE